MSSGFTDKLVTVDNCMGMASTSSIIFRVRTRDDATYVVVRLSYIMRATSRIVGCQPQQRSRAERYTKCKNR